MTSLTATLANNVLEQGLWFSPLPAEQTPSWKAFNAATQATMSGAAHAVNEQRAHHAPLL